MSNSIKSASFALEGKASITLVKLVNSLRVSQASMGAGFVNQRLKISTIPRM